MLPLRESFTGRLPPAEWYPAHEAGLGARVLDLGGGDFARVVEGGPGNGEPVLFLHGWGCSAYYWRRILPSVAATGRRVLALDLRGHGASAKPAFDGAYTAPAMRDFVGRAVDALGLARPHLVAHSLGGGIAIDWCRSVPGRARSLTLLAPVGLAAVRFVTLARLATPLVAAPLVPYAVPRWSIPLVLRAVWGHAGTWASRDVDEYWAPTGDAQFALALRELLHQYRFTARSDDELADIQAPVLALWGGRDLLVRSRASHARASRLAGWRSVLFEHAGHVLAEEVPEEVLRELVPHLGGTPVQA